MLPLIRGSISHHLAVSKLLSRQQSLRYFLSSQSKALRSFRRYSWSSVLKLSNKTYSEDLSIVPLYERQEDRITLPRAALGVSALNTSYWLWYSLDFIPVVNASPMQDLHIDPKIGWGALALGVAINAVTALYPWLLVSKIDYDPYKKKLLVHLHSLPFLKPSSSPIAYPLGDLTMDSTGQDLEAILGEYQGDFSMYRGHLALKGKDESLPLLLEVQNGREEVRDGEALLLALIRPRAFLSRYALVETNRGTGIRSKSPKHRKR